MGRHSGTGLILVFLKVLVLKENKYNMVAERKNKWKKTVT